MVDNSSKERHVYRGTANINSDICECGLSKMDPSHTFEPIARTSKNSHGLVSRLRAAAAAWAMEQTLKGYPAPPEHCYAWEAADEIERLTRELAWMTLDRDAHQRVSIRSMDRADRLRGALERLLDDMADDNELAPAIRQAREALAGMPADGPSVAMRTPILDLFVVELRKQLNLNPQHIEGRGHWPQNVELSGDEWAAIIGALAGGPAVEIAETSTNLSRTSWPTTITTSGGSSEETTTVISKEIGNGD